MPHLAVQFVGEHVAHERLVRIRRVEDPVRVGRQAENGDGRGVALSVDGFEGEGILWVTQRRTAANVDPAGTGKIQRAGKLGAIVPAIDELHGAFDLFLMHDIGAEGVHEHERKVGTEVQQLVLEQRVNRGGAAAWPLFADRLDPHKRRVADQQRHGIGRGGFTRFRAVQRVVNRGRAGGGENL